ncbi:MAG TPA: sulfotransferase, partial [Roseiflexaceae bacterium]|nr:sulfotransferase [Roseiflexaceae bacterium]
MSTPDARCVIILSARSSGSSALQNLLARSPGVRHVERTPHYESETLFWNKAASLLHRPQVRMADSRLPFPRAEAGDMLRSLLTENLGPSYVPPPGDEQLVFQGWRDLCLHYAPVFVEKTPHHLHQWGALELMLEGLARTPEVAPLVIGLVRNPMDTI